jgi:hypothetical protein
VDSRGRRYEFYVVGTVHTPGCASAEEVREVIERVRPDAVVLELDQERLDITVARSMVATSAEYGADLLAGAVAAERLGALVVLGDAKARSLPDLARAKMLTSPADLADLPRLWRSLRYLGRALGASADAFAAKPDADAPRFVRFAEALAADPGKLVPLRGPAAMAALALIASAREGVAAAHGVAATPSQAVSPLATLATLASSVAVGLAPSPADAVATALTALVAGRATEVLLEARDEVLAASAARAAAVAAATDRGALRRVAHAFDADADATAAAAASARADADAESSRRFGSASVTLPCFTLRRPLRAGETRRLNLFEPRWLAMIDAVAEARGGDPRGAEIACGLAVNRRYVSRAWLRDVDAKDAEARREDSLLRGRPIGTRRRNALAVVSLRGPGRRALRARGENRGRARGDARRDRARDDWRCSCRGGRRPDAPSASKRTRRGTCARRSRRTRAIPRRRNKHRTRRKRRGIRRRRRRRRKSSSVLADRPRTRRLRALRDRCAWCAWSVWRTATASYRVSPTRTSRRTGEKKRLRTPRRVALRRAKRRLARELGARTRRQTASRRFVSLFQVVHLYSYY